MSPIVNDTTNTPTITSTITPTLKPTAKPTKKVQKKKNTSNASVIRTVQVKVSHYTPWTGGTNCSNFQNGVCVSHLANGENWQNWIDNGAACVRDWSFGTKFRLPDGSVWTCVDRGGGIVNVGGASWVDLLTEHPGYSYGEVVKAEIIK